MEEKLPQSTIERFRRLATLACAMELTPRHPLYEYRKKHRLTRRQLAVQIGCSTRTLARWEKGHFCPRLAFAVRAGQVTGLAVEALGDSLWAQLSEGLSRVA